MKLFSVVVYALVAQLTRAATIPEGSPDGLYTFHTNETGHEVMTYHGSTPTLRDLFNGKSTKRDDAVLSAREHLSARAAEVARAAALEERQQWNVNCGPYTGLSYAPAAVGLAGECGDSTQFWGTIAWASASAVAYGCDYGNGNWCDFVDILRYNGYVDEWCGDNGNGWVSIPNYKLAFGRTQQGTCFCWC